MPYEIDMVSEFTYFENMLLGLADVLHKCAGVKRTHVKKSHSLTQAEIVNWENENGVLLPEDIRSFYLSSDGYHFEWTYTLSGDDSMETLIGKVELHSLENVIQVYGYETTNDPGVKYDGKRYLIKLAPESKLFQLGLLPGYGKVVLVYLYSTYVPTIWLLCSDMTLHYLAKDIATYLRMSIAHLGIPNWQLRFTSQGLPQWVLNIFRLIAPTLLAQNKCLEKMLKEREDETCAEDSNVPLNKIDPSAFDPTTYIVKVPITQTIEIPILPPLNLDKPIIKPDKPIKPEKLEKNEKPRLGVRKQLRQRKKIDKITKPRSWNSICKSL